jgi:hypothetical protein
MFKVRLIEDYYLRYRAPIIVTETSAYGHEKARRQWLEPTRAIRDLRSRGIPVVGYTWFPMFTMIGWRYRFGRSPIEKYRIELGLFRLSDEPAVERWLATPLVEDMRSCIQNPAQRMGELFPAEAFTPEPGRNEVPAPTTELQSAPGSASS